MKFQRIRRFYRALEMNEMEVEFKFKMTTKNKFWLQVNQLLIPLYRIYTRKNLSSRGGFKHLQYVRIGDTYGKLN